jgi:putative PIG3 family NAD(P)H quinone oxidoreductase
MRAIVITGPGDPDVLELRDVPSPVPQRGEVRVRVRATAINRADLLQRMGMYPAPPDSPRDIPGMELAGEVDAVGEGVTSLKLGDRVFGLVGGGAYAEEVVAPARTMVRIPEGLSFVEAAAIPEAFITAYDAMVVQGRLAAGETVLVHAVGSGVGTAAVQIARAIGAFPIGTARTADKLDRARPLGMAEGVVAKDGAFCAKVMQLTGGRGADVVLDLVGGAYVAEDLGCVANRARIVVVGLLAGARVDLDLGLVLRKRLEIRGTMLRARPLEEKIEAANLLARNIAPLLGNRALEPVVDKVLPLAKAADAHRYVASNEGFGKVVLEVD